MSAGFGGFYAWYGGSGKPAVVGGSTAGFRSLFAFWIGGYGGGHVQLPVITPTDRIVIVPAENRSLDLASENRIVDVLAEIRMVTISAEARLIEVPAENRVIVIPAEDREELV